MECFQNSILSGFHPDPSLCRVGIEGHGKDYTFFYTEEPDHWRPFGSVEDGRSLSPRRAGGFVGAYLGLSVSSRGQPLTNSADFDWLEYSGDDEIFRSSHPQSTL